MASNPNGHKFPFIGNGHRFESQKQIVNGREILEIMGLNPGDNFEILRKIKGEEYEPVELTEEKNLGIDSPQHFEVTPVKQLTIALDDDERCPVPNCFMTPVQILALKKMSKDEFYLKQILGHKTESYKEDENHVIAIVCGMKFSTCKKGPVTVS